MFKVGIDGKDHWRKDLHLSIVIPVHDEAANIVPLLEEIRQHLDQKYEYEVIVIDDHSTDGTGQILEDITKDFRSLKTIRLLHRCGQSGAVLQGVRSARHQVIVTLDGDGQNDPADIDTLVRQYWQTSRHSPRCLIIGHRQKRRDSLQKRLGSKMANWIRRKLLHDNTPDSGCGLKVFPRDFFLDFPIFNHMHRFLPALACQQGGMVISVEVHHRPRKNGTSHYGSLDRLAVGIFDLLGVVWLGRRAMNIQVMNERKPENG